MRREETITLVSGKSLGSITKDVRPRAVPRASAKPSVKRATRSSGKPTDSKRVAEIVARLAKAYPDAHCALIHSSPFQLLIATILSAQCTDERVNKTTPELFRKYPTARDLAAVRQEVLEQVIRSTGFYRNKAKNIIGASQRIVKEFGGKVPQTMEELLTLPGVARKTANVVLGNAFAQAAGVVVDTHVQRISRRLSLTKQDTPEKIERDLIKLLPQDQWINFPHQIIFHGRRCCIARKPKCAACPLEDLCSSKDKTN